MRQELAENIATGDLAQLEAQFRERIARTILNLQDHFESIRREVLARYRPRLGALTADQEQAVKALTCSVVNQIADLPISEIRRESEAKNGGLENREGRLISAARQIFRLSDIHAEEY